MLFLLWRSKPKVTGCDPPDADCAAYMTRLEEYCHRSLSHTTVGMEGKLPSSNFELVQVHIIARHGDRSPAIPYTIGPPAFYQCGLVDGSPLWYGLRDFEKVPLHPNIRSGYVELFPGMESKRCGIGMLTEYGYKQEYALGSMMRQKYSHFIGGSARPLPQEIFVQTTDYPRTIHSGAAFLLGFLPDDPEIRRGTKIHISPGSWLGAPPVGIDKIYTDKCRNFGNVWYKDLVDSGYISMEELEQQPMVEKLCDMFHIPKRNKPVLTELFDHILTRGCHNPTRPLPCNDDNECVDYRFAWQLFTLADWDWGQKFPINSSIIASLPFLRHSVVNVMENIIRDKQPSYSIMLSFTHDSTIVTILSAIGAPVQEWIPYASRLVFELWRTKDAQPVYYVRALFNGEPITGRIPFEGARELTHGCVEYATWKHYLTTGRFRDIDEYSEMCSNTQKLKIEH